MPMGTSDALMGLGMPAQLANVIGANPLIQNGAANATQTGATVIRSRNLEVNPGATTNSFIFLSNAPVMEPYFIVNFSGQTANIYPAVGQTMNNSLNGGFILATAKAAIVWQYKKGYWASILTA